MNPMSEGVKAENGVMSRVLTLTRAHTRTRDSLKKVKAKSYELPLEIRRKLSCQITPKLGVGDIRKLSNENTVCIRPGMTKAMGQIPLAYEYGLRRRDKQLMENRLMDGDTCERCQFCVEQLLLTDKGLFRLNMLCYSMGFTCEPKTVCRQWHEGQGRTILISDIRSKQEMAKEPLEKVLMEYVNDCVVDGANTDRMFAVEREKILQAKAKGEMS